MKGEIKDVTVNGVTVTISNMAAKVHEQIVDNTSLIHTKSQSHKYQSIVVDDDGVHLRGDYMVLDQEGFDYLRKRIKEKNDRIAELEVENERWRMTVDYLMETYC